MATLTNDALDAILATQLTVAWAGEGRCEPARLGWWDTDVIDEAAGGDFFARLLPRTGAWASLEAAREAARRADEKARAKMAHPDAMRTLFFLGFEHDEALHDRLASCKRSERRPADALPLRVPLTATFSRDELAASLKAVEVAFTPVLPIGRQMRGEPPASAELLVARLAAALVPFAEQYPLPFYTLRG